MFRAYEHGEWSKKPLKGMYDAVMVPLSELIASHPKLTANGSMIVEATRQLFLDKGVAAVTGRASTRKDLENRIAMFRELFIANAAA